MEEKWDAWQPPENIWSMGGKEGREQQVAGKGGRLKKSFPFFKALEKARLRWWHSS